MNGKQELPTDGEMDIAPWGAILTEVKRSGYRVAWLDDRIAQEAAREQALEAQRHDWEPEKYERARLAQSRELREWIKLGREERAHGAQVARSAVSAGLSERYIESVQAEARMIAVTLQRALSAADLSPEQWEAATAELRVALADIGRQLKDRHASMGDVLAERPALEA
jgi:hypothetical protein